MPFLPPFLSFTHAHALTLACVYTPQLNIPEDVCKKVLHSLACNKRNVILLKSPVGSTVAMTNT